MPKARKTKATLDPNEVLSSVRELIHWLTLGATPVYPAPSAGTTSRRALQQGLPPPVQWEPLTPDRTKELQALIQIQMKLLNKVLPDLKAIDFTDSTDYESILSQEELAQRVRSLMVGGSFGGDPLGGGDLSSSSLGARHPSHPRDANADTDVLDLPSLH
jgi:hypothetical protein